MGSRARGLGVGCLLLAVLVVGCGSNAPAAPPAATVAPTAAAASVPSAPVAAASAAPSTPALPTTPAVDLKVGVIPQASYGAFFIAQERGYFRELGLNVEFFPTGNLIEQLPAIV